jgi:hypothetical protein
MLEMVVSSGQMLDAGYLMLDIQECTNSEIEKQPVPSIQDLSILTMIFAVMVYM